MHPQRMSSLTNARHLDRSSGRLDRPLRSGETPVFAFRLAGNPTHR